jgi:hypothetical protein
MKTKTNKTINSKAERELASELGFKGKYVSSLLSSAARHCNVEIDKPTTAQGFLSLIAKQRAERIKAKWGLSVRAFDQLTEKGRQILRSFSTGYSMGEIKEIKIGSDVFLSVDNTREYARTSRFRATHGRITVTIDLASLRAIERIEGVWTVRRPGNRASWLQSRGSKNTYAVCWVHGFNIGNSHGKTLEECQLLENGKAISHDGQIRRLDRFVGLRDRVKAGACEAGVLAFCERNNLDPDLGYRIDYLLGLNDPIAKTYLERLSRTLSR